MDLLSTPSISKLMKLCFCPDANFIKIVWYLQTFEVPSALKDFRVLQNLLYAMCHLLTWLNKIPSAVSSLSETFQIVKSQDSKIFDLISFLLEPKIYCFEVINLFSWEIGQSFKNVVYRFHSVTRTSCKTLLATLICPHLEGGKRK